MLSEGCYKMQGSYFMIVPTDVSQEGMLSYQCNYHLLFYIWPRGVSHPNIYCTRDLTHALVTTVCSDKLCHFEIGVTLPL